MLLSKTFSNKGYLTGATESPIHSIKHLLAKVLSNANEVGSRMGKNCGSWRSIEFA